MLELRVPLEAALQCALEELVAIHRTLEDVVRWGLALTPPVIIADVVVQDEYTHDVVLRHPSSYWLVYDTT
jgi:hypothetical protein